MNYVRPNERLDARYRLASKLLGTDEGWISLCRDAVPTGKLQALEDDQNLWEALSSDTSVRPRAAAGSLATPTSTDIAHAILNIAHALTGRPDANQLVVDSMDILDNCGHSSPAGFRPQNQPNHRNAMLGDVQAVIENANPDHPSATFVSLLARYLSGDDLAPIRTVVVPVLFDQVNFGSVGHLRISEIRTGPAGIHPHPKTMTFLVVDKAFNQALRDAWAISPLRASERCLLWELTDAKTHAPLHHVAGASLGAAWYIALDELKRGKFTTLLRFRKLDPNCAATGSLDGTMLASVKGYENKLKAAAENNLRVVYPAVDSRDAERAATRYAAMATPAKDAPSAVRATRSRPNRWAPLIIFSMIAAAVLTAVTTGMFYSNQIATAERKETATSLINKSNELRSTDPRLSALLALASHKLMARPESAMAMANTALTNQFTSAVLEADPGRIVALKGTGNMLIHSSHKAITAWDVRSQTKLWTITTGSTIQDVELSPDGQTLILIDALYGLIKFYSISNAEAKLVRIAENRPEAGTVPWHLPLNPLTEGHQLVAIIRDNSIEIVEFTNQGRRLVRSFPAGQPSNTIRVISDWKHNIHTGQTERILVLFDGTVLTWSVSGGIEQLVPPGQVPHINTVDRNFISNVGDILLFGTTRGTVIWSVKEKSLLQSPGADPVSDLVAVNQGFASRNSAGITLTPGVPRPNDVSSYPTSSSLITRPGITSFTFVPEGNVLAAATQTGQIILFEPWAEDALSRSMTIAEAIAFTPANHLVVASRVKGGDSIVVKIPKEESLKPPLLQPGRLVYSTDTWGIDGEVKFSDLAADSRYVVGTTTSGHILIWDASTGQPLRHLTDAKVLPMAAGTPSNHIEVALVNGGNTLVAFNRGNGTYDAWETKSWAKLESIKSSYSSNWPDRMSVAPGGLEVVFLQAHHEAAIIDTKTGKLKTLVPIGDAGSSNDSFERVWINAESHLVVQSGDRMSVKARDGSTLTTRRFDSPIRGVIPSPDGTTLAVYSNAHSIQLLDSTNLQAARPAIESLDAPFLPWSASWAQDGQMLATIDTTSGYVTMLFPNQGSWEDRMCTIAGNDLTPAERLTYIGPADRGFQFCD
ncbi:WD40 repeat domain-containing protein [Arthrobacter sp. Z4-13]